MTDEQIVLRDGSIVDIDSPEAKAAYVQRCDHICIRDDGHVERGEPHFYGYELPSPRSDPPREMTDLEETLLALTIWTQSISMQVRQTEVMLHVMDDARRSSEDFHPVSLTKQEARRIRDLLNFATARGDL